MPSQFTTEGKAFKEYLKFAGIRRESTLEKHILELVSGVTALAVVNSVLH